MRPSEKAAVSVFVPLSQGVPHVSLKIKCCKHGIYLSQGFEISSRFGTDRDRSLLVPRSARRLKKSIDDSRSLGVSFPKTSYRFLIHFRHSPSRNFQPTNA